MFGADTRPSGLHATKPAEASGQMSLVAAEECGLRRAIPDRSLSPCQIGWVLVREPGSLSYAPGGKFERASPDSRLIAPSEADAGTTSSRSWACITGRAGESREILYAPICSPHMRRKVVTGTGAVVSIPACMCVSVQYGVHRFVFSHSPPSPNAPSASSRSKLLRLRLSYRAACSDSIMHFGLI